MKTTSSLRRFSLLDELDRDLIGLTPVKQRIRDIAALLVIDKLPFPPPDDPLMRARGERAEALGLSAFNDVWLPEAAMALKQGVGRLIRSETDRGVLVIGDRRLLTRSYGNRLLAALPAMRRLQDEAEMGATLDELVLTRSSTTVHPPT